LNFKLIISKGPTRRGSLQQDKSKTTTTTADHSNNIEKEMNQYLNSNKAFFDAQTLFPSFNAIEYTLINNLKSQCMSVTDQGYLCLISMMKSNQNNNNSSSQSEKQKILKQKPTKIQLFKNTSERITCALVSPFILRNSKALQYIMINLNGLDYILDLLLFNSRRVSGEGCSSFCFSSDSITNLENTSPITLSILKLRAIHCIKRILKFVNYKYDSKKLNEYFVFNLEEFQKMYYCCDSIEQDRVSSMEIETTTNVSSVLFHIQSDDDQNQTRTIKAQAQILAKKSQYFSILLEGTNFCESKSTFKIENDISSGNDNEINVNIRDVSYEALEIIINLLNCYSNTTGDQDINLLNEKNLSFELCYEIVIACDRFFLKELKDLFISILCKEFLSMSTWIMFFQLSWYLDNSFLIYATIDFLLSKFLTVTDYSTYYYQNEDDTEDDCDGDTFKSNNEYRNKKTKIQSHKSSTVYDSSQFMDLLDQTFVGIQKIASDSMKQQKQLHHTHPIDFFYKKIKYALTEIIKNNFWKL
jgi:hypothetical protein